MIILILELTIINHISDVMILTLKSRLTEKKLEYIG